MAHKLNHIYAKELLRRLDFLHDSVSSANKEIPLVREALTSFCDVKVGDTVEANCWKSEKGTRIKIFKIKYIGDCRWHDSIPDEAVFECWGHNVDEFPHPSKFAHYC